MTTREERQKLREAARAVKLRAFETSPLSPLLEWKLQTSNSFRRIGQHGDGDVLCATKHPHDGQPDLLAAPGALDYIVAAQPRVVSALLDDLDALEDKLDQSLGITTKIEDVDRRLRAMASGLCALSDAFVSFTEAPNEVEMAVAAEKVREILAQLTTQIIEVPR